MGPFNSNDMKQNADRIQPGSRWRLRHSKGFFVEIVAVTGNLVHIRHLQRQHNRHTGQKRATAINRYGFLQVYKPL